MHHGHSHDAFDAAHRPPVEGTPRRRGNRDPRRSGRGCTHVPSAGGEALHGCGCHVANKDELLKAAASRIIASAIDVPHLRRDPAEAVRSTAAAVFDAIDAHPWAGAQLAREPWQLAVIRLFETFGQLLRELGVPESAQFDAVSTLVNYILGLAGQYAAGARVLGTRADRSVFLRGVAEQWERLDPVAFPFMRSLTEGFDQHDDRTQFLAGIDLILAGATPR
jgi:hypothetical protein